MNALTVSGVNWVVVSYDLYSKIKGRSQVTVILPSKLARVYFNFTLGPEEAGEGVAAHFCQNSIDEYPNCIWVNWVAVSYNLYSKMKGSSQVTVILLSKIALEG